MIRARMYWDNMRLEVTGHAGYAEAGKDIVCAGASMLTAALQGVLDDAHQRGRTTFTVKDNGERLLIIADPMMGSMNEIKAYYRMCVKGFRMLAGQYPEYVKCEEV